MKNILLSLTFVAALGFISPDLITTVAAFFIGLTALGLNLREAARARVKA